MPSTSVETTSSTEKSPQTQRTPHPTRELTIADFAELPHKPQEHQNTDKSIPIEKEFSDDSMENQSRAVIPKKPIQTTFKRPTGTTSDSEETSTTNTFTKEQRNLAIHICREPHKYSFRDVDRIQTISTDKKRCIISKAMFIILGDYDPSNEYISNYSDAKTSRLYRKLTENRIDIETLYLQIYNQLTKDKPKGTKHTN